MGVIDYDIRRRVRALELAGGGSVPDPTPVRLSGDIARDVSDWNASPLTWADLVKFQVPSDAAVYEVVWRVHTVLEQTNPEITAAAVVLADEAEWDLWWGNVPGDQPLLPVGYLRLRYNGAFVWDVGTIEQDQDLRVRAPAGAYIGVLGTQGDPDIPVATSELYAVPVA